MPHEATNEYEATKAFSLTSKMDGDSTALEIDINTDLKMMKVACTRRWVAATTKSLPAKQSASDVYEFGNVGFVDPTSRHSDNDC